MNDRQLKSKDEISNDIINKKGPKPLELKGNRFGKLLVITKALTRDRYSYWTCQCDCGTIKEVRGSSLTRIAGTRSCGCLQRERSQLVNRELPYFWMLAYIKSKHYCDLSYVELLDFTEITQCHYCSSDVQWNMHKSQNGKRLSGKYNLDRKDNSRGYSKDNCVVCCTVCNYFKGDRFTYDEMIEIGKTFKKLKVTRNENNIPWVKVYSER